MRALLRKLSWALLLLAALPVASEYFVELARSFGLYDDPQAALRWPFRAMSAVASYWLYPWIAGGGVGFFLGVWLDWIAKWRDRNAKVTGPIYSNAEFKDVLKALYTHAGSLDSDRYLADAKVVIEDKMVDFINEPYTQQILRAMRSICIALTTLQKFSLDAQQKIYLEKRLVECSQLMLSNFNKWPRWRNNACRDFIKALESSLPQEPRDIEAGTPP